MKYRVTCTGTRPLLMHNERLASSLDPYTKQIKTITDKRSKMTDDDLIAKYRLEFEGGMYWDAETGPVIPGKCLFASIQGAARTTRNGKDIERGVVVTDFQMPLIYDGPRTVEGLWGDGTSKWVDVRLVGLNNKRVDRCRPIFPEWAIEAEILLDETVLNPETFELILQRAGMIEGLGDYRKLYGRYEVEFDRM